MNKIVKLLPGLTGAACGFVLLKFISWTGLIFPMESAMRSHGNKL